MKKATKKNELTVKVLRTIVAETEHPTDDCMMYTTQVTFRIIKNGRKMMDVTITGNDNMTPEGARIEVLRLLEIVETFRHLAAIEPPVSQKDVDKTLAVAGRSTKWMTSDDIMDRGMRRLGKEVEDMGESIKRLERLVAKANETIARAEETLRMYDMVEMKGEEDEI